MQRIIKSALTAVTVLAVFSSAQAQLVAGINGWYLECADLSADPPVSPYSTDYGTFGLNTSLMGIEVGISGTVTYGGQNGPCYGPTSRSLQAVGRMSLYVGPVGSIQSDFDNLLALTVGSPTDPVGDYCYGKILKDGDLNANSVLYGNGGYRTFYTGASKRYMITAWQDADVDVEVQYKLIGDAVRVRWRMTNQKNVAQRLGLLFGCYPGMRTFNAGITDSTGSNQALSLLSTNTGTPKFTPDRYIGHVNLPVGRPLRNPHRYAISNPKFPTYATFNFGQSEAYGLRVDNIPPTYMPDASTADLFVVDNHGAFQSPGLIWNNNIRTVVFGDTEANPSPNEEADVLLNEVAFVQRYPAIAVEAGGQRDVVQYFRGTWGIADYVDPYTAVLDAPRLLATDPSGFNGVSPNPFTIRAYIDNQYATLDKEVAMHQVRLTITVGKGLSLATGETSQKTISLINPNQIASMNWVVQSDGKTFGDVPFSVTIEPTPGPAKTLTGKVRVAATPRMQLPPGASLVTIPYSFVDTSMDDILKLQAGVDYIAYRWDPDQSEYAPAISVERGVGYWILPTSDLGFKTLEGATQPTDQAQGGLLVSLHQGWNLIGNPYTYAVPVSQLVLAVEDSPKDTYSWADAVANNYVQSSLVSWQRDEALPGGGQYVYTEGLTALLEPHVGYWVYVSTFKPVRVSWPPVFADTLPNSGRKVETGWEQKDRHWKLQLSARGSNGIDSQNFVGVVPDKTQVVMNQMRKAPTSPGQNVELFISQDLDGKAAKLTQALSERPGRNEWNVTVKAKEAGDVTVTWPNLPSIPRNLRAKLIDVATNEATDLRLNSGYTFRMSAPGNRQFKVVVEPGGSTRATIGSVMVTRSGGSKSINSPVTVSYSLSAEAVVSVRVLSGLSKEVCTITQGKSMKAGQNKVTWALRDSANRAVAPGTYNMEILAETPNGERVRRIVPINLSR